MRSPNYTWSSVREARNIEIEIDGVRYESLVKLAAAHSIGYQTIYGRYRAGLRGRALLAPTGRRQKTPPPEERT